MYSITGILLTAAGSVLLCVSWAIRLGKRAAALHGWIRALAMLEVLPLSRAEGMAEMLERAAAAANCREVESALRSCAGRLLENRLLSLEEIMEKQPMEALKKEDRAALRPVWKALDQADARGVSAVLRAAAAQIEKLSLEADEILRRDRRLALSLGPLAAAAAALAMM